MLPVRQHIIFTYTYILWEDADTVYNIPILTVKLCVYVNIYMIILYGIICSKHTCQQYILYSYMQLY